MSEGKLWLSQQMPRTAQLLVNKQKTCSAEEWDTTAVSLEHWE